MNTKDGVEKRLRRYGQWAGNPRGVAEDVTRCIKPVRNGGSYVCRQCSRKRGFGRDGLYCKQHAEGSDMWIVELEPGVWLAEGDGDPPRTLLRRHARRFATYLTAHRALMRARRWGLFELAVISAT